MENRSAKDYWLVGMQFVLFILFLIPFNYSFEVPKMVLIPSLIVSIFGFIIAVIAIFNLDKSLTAFPTPKDDAKLITTGLYRFARHPIYSGVLLTVFGYALYSQSLSRLCISFALLLLFYIKTNYEETKLSKRYPDYSSYKAIVGRFMPRVW